MAGFQPIIPLIGTGGAGETPAPGSLNYWHLCENKEARDLAKQGLLNRSYFDESGNFSRHDIPGAEFRDEMGVLSGLIVVGLIILFFFWVDRWWKRQTDQAAKETVSQTDAVEYAKSLVKLFMPSWKLEKYQFRGMRRKERGVSMEFDDLSLALKHNGKTVLKGVTGEFQAGRMCAIMGPSGAGKTTFLNVLCGKATYGDMGGRVSINGHNATVRDIKSITGFVPQDDIVHENLTVREQIGFSAFLRNKVGTSRKRLMAITDDVLNVMQIVEIQNSRVGGVTRRGISGGQRKRVNIGLELAAQPTVLFLDEPTSGLDSSSSLAVVASLKKMTELSMTTIMVIHQPRFSLFTLFDDVLLLGKGGQTVYLGPSTGAKQYFEGIGFSMPLNENPADWFMDIISGELDKNQVMPEGFKPSELFKLWEQHRGDVAQSMTRTGTGRVLTYSDDIIVLRSALEDEWDQIDLSRDGLLQQEELRSLLRRASGCEPSDAVLEDIVNLMAGPDAEAITKDEFVEYLSSLRGVVARDAIAQLMDSEEQREMQEKEAAELYQLLHANSLRLPTPSLPELCCRKCFQPCEEDCAGSDSDVSSADSDDSEETDMERARSLQRLNRVIPGFCRQTDILYRRKLVEWWRCGPERSVFLAALAVGAVVLGVMDMYVAEQPAWQVMSVLNVHMALALLISIFSLGLFGSDRPVFWRESSTGLNVMAHFLSRVVLNLVDLFIFTFVFTAIYYMILRPNMYFGRYFLPYLLISFASSGWGYFVSTVVPPEHGAFIVSLVMFVICGLLGNPGNLATYLGIPTLEWAVNLLSITRWSVLLAFMDMRYADRPIPEGGPQTQVYCLSVYTFGKNEDDYFSASFTALLSMGVVLHILALCGLKFMYRDKQV